MHVIIPYFNPIKYQSLFRNYNLFVEQLESQKVPYITVELSFDGTFQIKENDNVFRLRSNSVMWQKERLINFGVSQLPKEADSFAWIDCDVLFDDKSWYYEAQKALEQYDVIQLFKRVYYLPKGDTRYCGNHTIMVQSVMWQQETHRNWLARRVRKELPFSTPGFAWACRRSSFFGGLYDKNIVGSGDTFIVDSLLNSWDIHGFAQKFNRHMKFDMWNWLSQQKTLKYSYIPRSIYHLYHGSLKNRQYMDRHQILIESEFNPNSDIVLSGDVYEWSSDKKELHDTIYRYFLNRNEDE